MWTSEDNDVDRSEKPTFLNDSPCDAYVLQSENSILSKITNTLRSPENDDRRQDSHQGTQANTVNQRQS